LADPNRREDEAAVLAEKHREAEAAWKGVALTLERFAGAIVASRRPDEDLDTLHTKDLYLVLACLDADPRAIEVLHETLRSVRPSIERACRDCGISADDVLQGTLEKLLVGKGKGKAAEAPKLAQYTGRGPLVAWLRVVAMREALQDHRRGARARRNEEASAFLANEPPLPMEIALLRDRHIDAFRAAVKEAMGRLTPEQRTLLRFHTVDGLSIDELAPLLAVHRATVARRLERARTDVLEHTQSILSERHGLTKSEAESLCKALGTGVDVSIARALDGDLVP
jgi:RNA polymerase sigma-70 factor (ECF subfamily)